MTSRENSIDTPEPDPPPADGHESNDTLRYHLLGPSLTKAGQDAVDQQKVTQSIQCFTSFLEYGHTHICWPGL